MIGKKGGDEMRAIGRIDGSGHWTLAGVALALLACECGGGPGDRTASPAPADMQEIEPFGTCTQDGQGPVPENLDQALDELPRVVGAANVDQFERHDPIEFHHGFGTALRNCWGLWAGGDGLASWFAEQGITHPDDMSSIVLTSFHRKLNGKEIDLAGQIAEIKAFWDKQKQSYEDGSSSANSLFHVVEFAEGAGWVSVSGANIPHVGDLVTPLIDHCRAGVEACWKRFPKTPGNSAVDTSIRIAIDDQGQLVSAEVTDSAIPKADAECLAQVLVGASIPEHKGAKYELVFQTFRFSAPGPAP
jgi:hypothetical protein